MENTCFPRSLSDMADKIRDCAESCVQSGVMLTPDRLAYLANWKPGYARLAMQTYAGMLNDARRLHDYNRRIGRC